MEGMVGGKVSICSLSLSSSVVLVPVVAGVSESSFLCDGCRLLKRVCNTERYKRSRTRQSLPPLYESERCWNLWHSMSAEVWQSSSADDDVLVVFQRLLYDPDAYSGLLLSSPQSIICRRRSQKRSNPRMDVCANVLQRWCS